MAGARTALAESAAGKIFGATGPVQIQRGGAAMAARPGTLVIQGDQIAAGADGHAIIMLSDGSKLELRPATSITLDQYVNGGATPTRIGLTSGILKSDVNGTGEAPANFQVHTPNAIVTAHGTTFYTSYTPTSPQTGNLPGVSHYTEVAVIEGTVNLAQAAAPASGVEVAQGTTGTVPGAAAPQSHKRHFPTCSNPPTSVDQCKDGGWRQFGCFKNQGQCIGYVHHE
ncbi:MAG: FecR family protein [Candidatus Binatus sp.]